MYQKQQSALCHVNYLSYITIVYKHENSIYLIVRYDLNGYFVHFSSHKNATNVIELFIEPQKKHNPI